MDNVKAGKVIKEIAYSHFDQNILDAHLETNQKNALLESIAIALAEAYISGYQNASKESNQR